MVNQLYTVNVMDESVLRGNTAILKCHIPSFVTDYVFVSGWTSDHGDEYSINANQAHGIDNPNYICFYGNLSIFFFFFYKIFGLIVVVCLKNLVSSVPPR